MTRTIPKAKPALNDNQQLRNLDVTGTQKFTTRLHITPKQRLSRRWKRTVLARPSPYALPSLTTWTDSIFKGRQDV